MPQHMPKEEAQQHMPEEEAQQKIAKRCQKKKLSKRLTTYAKEEAQQQRGAFNRICCLIVFAV